MYLVNSTSVPAKLMVSSPDGSSERFGILVAKATFAMAGQREGLTTQDPFPIFEGDQPTNLGLLPSDVQPRRDRAFEVILLGAAHARDGKLQVSQVVEVSVGSVTRRVVAFGDRRWQSPTQISEPVVFDRMPLTYERAFGGTCPVNFDAHTILDVEDRLNKYGRGFNVEKPAKDFAAGLKSPAGFPKYQYQRLLPNLEHPAHLIRSWNDTPEPHCWATVPEDIGFRMIRTIRKFEATRQPPTREEAIEQAFHRAHPDWIIPLPPPRTWVTLTGLAPGEPISFPLPQLRLVADYVAGERSGSRELAPHLLMLLPEQHKFYIVYRTAFTMSVQPESERGFRLRLADGWFQYSDTAATVLASAG